MDERVIVSMTSWKERIRYVGKTIYCMHMQTYRPDIIYLVLSMDEFPNGMEELPEDLSVLVQTIPELEVIWVKENTKAFKKLIPALWRHKDEDAWVLTVDDDVYYAPGYIKYMLEEAKKHFGYVLNPRMAGNWLHGAFGCYHTSYFKNSNIFDLTISEMKEFVEDDKWYSYCYRQNGIKDFPERGISKFYRMYSLPKPLSKDYFSINVKGNISKILKKYKRG